MRSRFAFGSASESATAPGSDDVEPDLVRLRGKSDVLSTGAVFDAREPKLIVAKICFGRTVRKSPCRMKLVEID